MKSVAISASFLHPVFAFIAFAAKNDPRIAGHGINHIVVIYILARQRFPADLANAIRTTEYLIEGLPPRLFVALFRFGGVYLLNHRLFVRCDQRFPAFFSLDMPINETKAPSPIIFHKAARSCMGSSDQYRTVSFSSTPSQYSFPSQRSYCVRKNPSAAVKRRIGADRSTRFD